MDNVKKKKREYIRRFYHRWCRYHRRTADYHHMQFSQENNVQAEPLTTEHESADELSQKDRFIALVSGYLFMALKELSCFQKDYRIILQRVEKRIKDNDYETALAEYKNAVTALLPIIIEGVVIPYELYDVKISALKYSSYSLLVKITNTLKNNGIERVGDFSNHNDLARDLSGIGYFRKNCRDEFVSALKRSIADLTAESAITSVKTVEDLKKEYRAEFAKPFNERDLYLLCEISLMIMRTVGTTRDSVSLDKVNLRVKNMYFDLVGGVNDVIQILQTMASDAESVGNTQYCLNLNSVCQMLEKVIEDSMAINY